MKIVIEGKKKIFHCGKGKKQKWKIDDESKDKNFKKEGEK